MSTRNAGWTALAAALLAPLGWLLVLLAERIWAGTLASPYLAALGAAALLAALALHAPNFQAAREGGARGAAGWLAAPYALSVLALALYYGGTLLPPQGGGAVDWAALASGGWMLALTASAVLYVFLTLARLAQRNAPQPDARRLRAAGSAGLSLALLVLLVVLLNVVLDGLPWQWNLAYFRSTQPSEATVEVARTLSEPVQVVAFFEADSSVKPFIEGYFQTLAGEGAEQLQVRYADAFLDPGLAESYKARGNGWVVLRKGELFRPLFIGDTFERSRPVLRTFDRTFFTKLVELARPRKIVYFTVGHGERLERGAVQSPVTAFGNFRKLLGERNYTLKELGAAAGLGEGVPADAALVVVAAPTRPFLPGELEALKAYLDQGGRMLVFLEPVLSRGGSVTPAVAPQSIETLLQDYGVDFDPVTQANDRVFGRRTYTPADHALLVTVRYENHASVSTAHRTPGQYPLLMLGAGALRAGKTPPKLIATPTVRGMPGTWGDKNGDYRFEANQERRDDPVLAMAVGARPKAGTSSEAKAGMPALVIFSDADLAGDLLLQNRANRVVLQDAMGWLVAGDQPVGAPTSEEDVPILHAKADEWLWFYLPVVGVPALVLGFGLLLVSRRRRSQGGGHA